MEFLCLRDYREFAKRTDQPGWELIETFQNGTTQNCDIFWAKVSQDKHGDFYRFECRNCGNIIFINVQSTLMDSWSVGTTPGCLCASPKYVEKSSGLYRLTPMLYCQEHFLE